MLYTDGENGGKQDGKEKDKGYGGDETSMSGVMFMFAMIYLSGMRIPSEAW